ncbi:MAG: threonine/serine dehydratase [Burkholderiales bacterium]
MRSKVEEAALRVGSRVRKTPVIELDSRTMLKLELLQHSGSFKPRGAFNRMLSVQIPASGVIAASGGNHGAAVAYAARELGVAAEIFVPSVTPATKLARLRAYEATLRQTGASYAEAFVAMEAQAAKTGALIVHAYDQEEVVAGQGTLARELELQISGLDAVFVAVGGGGLIGGVAGWFENRVRVIGVEPSSCATLHDALKAGHPVDVSVSGIAADSLGAKRIGSIAFALAQKFVSEVVLVTDEEIRQAQRHLWEQFRIAAEPGGAAALAGYLSGRAVTGSAARVAVIVCGANADPQTMAR